MWCHNVKIASLTLVRSVHNTKCKGLFNVFVFWKADREKEAQKARDEEARQRRERQENEERELAERQKAEVERSRERKRNEIRRRLPKEPEATDSRKMARLRFRIPVKGDAENMEEDSGSSNGNGLLSSSRKCPVSPCCLHKWRHIIRRA